MLLNKAEYNPPIFRVHHAINGEEAGRADELEVCCRQSGDVTCIRALCRTQPTFSLDPPSARSMLATRSYFCNCVKTLIYCRLATVPCTPPSTSTTRARGSGWSSTPADPAPCSPPTSQGVFCIDSRYLISIHTYNVFNASRKSIAMEVLKIVSSALYVP